MEQNEKWTQEATDGLVNMICSLRAAKCRFGTRARPAQSY